MLLPWFLCTNICLYTYTYIRTYVCTYTHTYIHTYMNICVCTWLHTELEDNYTEPLVLCSKTQMFEYLTPCGLVMPNGITRPQGVNYWSWSSFVEEMVRALFSTKPLLQQDTEFLLFGALWTHFPKKMLFKNIIYKMLAFFYCAAHNMLIERV